MVEQPIRVSDVIEIDGNYGKVVRIGARCTQLRTFSNIDILVPNSSFLEKNVVNWTLLDDRIRTSITVGVSYESDTKKVETLLLAVAEAHPVVLKEPEPVVLFENFGDNTLDFKLEIWMRIIGHDRRETESEIRHQIVQIFREHKIVIAFPQRDIHFDGPLEVSLKK